MLLLNMQHEKYPRRFRHNNWTCMSTMYNQCLEFAVKTFLEVREMTGRKSKVVDWDVIDARLYYFAAGMSENWKDQKPWNECDYLFGIDNCVNEHWFAYCYDFIEKKVRIYDSLLGGYEDERQAVINRHATLAPSLYNVNLSKEEDMFDPDLPFEVELVMDVPQQENGYDCGMYACKVIQCLAMGVDYKQLNSTSFKSYRKKMMIDMLKWKQSKTGDYSVQSIKLVTTAAKKKK